MSVKGKVKRLNAEIENLKLQIINLEMKNQTEKLKHNTDINVLNSYRRNMNRIEKDFDMYENVLKQLVIRECGGLRGGINLTVDRCVDDIDFEIDEVESFGNYEMYMKNQKCYTIRIHPKWR